MNALTSAKRPRKPNGAVLYSGPSRFNEDPIQLRISGITRKSANRKTGPMVQAWVTPKPNDVKKGPTAVCGDCPIKKICYVDTSRAPLAVARANYPESSVSALPDSAFRKPWRLGAWGDFGALPTRIIRAIIKRLRPHHNHPRPWTGYTHAWARRPSLAPFLMASVESTELAASARARGFRTFRTLLPGDTIDPDSEILCPNYSHGTSCADCLLCNGKASPDDPRPSIAIPVHGGLAQILGPDRIRSAIAQ